MREPKGSLREHVDSMPELRRLVEFAERSHLAPVDLDDVFRSSCSYYVTKAGALLERKILEEKFATGDYETARANLRNLSDLIDGGRDPAIGAHAQSRTPPASTRRFARMASTPASIGSMVICTHHSTPPPRVGKSNA